MVHELIIAYFYCAIYVIIGFSAYFAYICRDFAPYFEGWMSWKTLCWIHDTFGTSWFSTVTLAVTVALIGFAILGIICACYRYVRQRRIREYQRRSAPWREWEARMEARNQQLMEKNYQLQKQILQEQIEFNRRQIESNQQQVEQMQQQIDTNNHTLGQ